MGSSTTTSYTDSGLPDGTTYWYAVTGVNPSGEGAASTAVSGQTASQNQTIYLSGAAMISGSGCVLTFAATPGSHFVVVAATDVSLPLSNWTVLGSVPEVPSGSGQYEFTDLDATNLPYRFYRVRSQ